jgi:hypothetical protein
MLTALIPLLAGCGLLGSASGPSAQPDAPTRLIQIPIATPRLGATQITIYLPRLFDDGSLGLQGVPRYVVLSNDPVRDVLTSLIRGPDGNERAENYQYALDRRTQVVVARSDADTAHVEFDEALRRVHGRPFSELVYWSIVYTLTELPGIEGVALWQGDRPLATLGDPPFPVPPRGVRAAAPSWARPR